MANESAMDIDQEKANNLESRNSRARSRILYVMHHIEINDDRERRGRAQYSVKERECLRHSIEILYDSPHAYPPEVQIDCCLFVIAATLLYAFLSFFPIDIRQFIPRMHGVSSRAQMLLLCAT